ncbi:hypothetical protein KW797_01545 [Candidatus Parcubacteria bacterium]|nr:hypothetical protein [Candidatus Parcubacteria bacterium]
MRQHRKNNVVGVRVRARLISLVKSFLPKKTLFHPVELERHVREKFSRRSKEPLIVTSRVE